MPKITYDWSGPDAPPGVGDTLAAMSTRTHEFTGTAYLILTARKVKRTTRPRMLGVIRMSYGVERIDLDDALNAPRCNTLVWHSRSRHREE